MISTQRLYNSVMQSAKSGTAGYQSAAEFNIALNDVQVDVLTLLRPHFESNQMVKDLLAPFVKSVSASSSLPSDYFSFVSATINGQPSSPIDNNQAAIYSTSPVRSPSASGQSYHYFVNGGVQFLTPSGVSGTMTYIRYPNNASVVATPVSTDDSDYVNVSDGVQLEWPESAYNLFYYKMLERFGLEMKESLLIEYSRLGIQVENIKIQ